jgi:hypothetical protein
MPNISKLENRKAIISSVAPALQGNDSQSATADRKAPHERRVSEQSAANGDAPDTATPLVSIVIPCYNSARYLAESLESAVAQSYPKIEIIVVDDGSSDATSSIAQSYPVKYIYQENSGISAARNAGTLRSKGKYLVFLDSDDRLLPTAVETGVRLLEEHPECAIAVGEHRYIGPDGRVIGRSNKGAVGRDHYLMLLVNNFIETPCSALHRRSTLATTGGFDETVQVAEDHELYLRIARGHALVAHEATVSEYRIHDSSTSGDAERMLLMSHRVLQMELPYLQGDQAKLCLHQRGVNFLQRRFGRKLTDELMRGERLTNPERRRKLEILRRHYILGFAAIALSRLIPKYLLTSLLALKRNPMYLSRGRPGYR